MKFLIICNAVLLLVGIGEVRGVEETVENGIIYANEAWGLRYNYPIMSMQNTRFPGMAPANLIQTWRYVAEPDAALRVKCDNIDLPKNSDGSCGAYSLTLEDGADRKVFCGSIVALDFRSKTYDITFTLRTGDQSRGLINCTVVARQMGPYGEVTEPPTTQAPRPTRPAFLTMESEEIDSSEFGGPPGRVGTTCPCGTANKHMTRIIAGEEAKVNEYPFAVILTYRGSYWPFCGGSLLTRRHVISAAHCVWGARSDDVAVGMGDHDFILNSTYSPHRKVVNVKQIISHEAYATKKQYDIALLVLDEVVKYNQYISPVCLPSKPLNLDWKYLTAMGWGRVGWGASDGQSNYLKKMKVRGVPLSLCARWTSASLTEPHQLCTFGRNRGLGKGDSGGPVVWLDPETNRYTIVGLPSFVYPFETNNFRPDVTADVSSFLPWIHEQIRRTDPSNVPCTSVH